MFSRAHLSNQELRIMCLEAVLAARGEQWSAKDKEKFLGMKQGTYGAALYRARRKLISARTEHDISANKSAHERLLKAIFGD
jgi:DNA-directed RNA polymerase specialized sigma24 family protein